MNNERVLEALERAQYGTGDEDEMFDDREILAEAVRELAWYVATGNVDSGRERAVEGLAAAIMEESHE